MVANFDPSADGPAVPAGDAAALPVPFDISFRYVDSFPQSPSGKHEELISYVADPPRG